MKISRIIALVFLAYVVAVAIGVESINSTQEGGVLQNWHECQREMYANGGGGSGVGKMRGDSGFQDILTIFGIWVYPFSVIAAVIFIRQAIAAKTKVHSCVLFICSFICLLILARFMWLGVFSAGAGIG